MTLKNKTLLLVPVIFLLVFSIFRIGLFRNSKNDFVQVLNKVFVGNEMIVKFSPDIDLQKIKINLAFSDKTVFEQGRFLNNIGEAYGGPIFDVYYDNLLVGRAVYDNTNEWYVNEFLFDFFRDDKQIKFTFIPNGRDKYGDVAYIWIKKTNDSLSFESYRPSGELINKWKE